MTLQDSVLPAPVEALGTNPPAPTTGLTNADLARLRRSLDSSVSDNTRAMYNSARKTLKREPRPRAPFALRPPRPWSPPTWQRISNSRWSSSDSTRPLATPKRREDRVCYTRGTI